ncbi:MAG TPA: response regulator transcription factor [Steroidobacteraceae bacterium]|jgi:DNA-binding NarL/FixJ family response regulator|nr:response regulator transcription factor [Steroidobacteraceae bacterium]
MEETHLAEGVQRREDPALRILIGENNSDLAMTLSLLLDAEPDMHCVSTVASGRAVLHAVDEYAPNAFILDLSLDDGSSLPLIGILRQRLPHAVIVVFTGHRNELLSEQCVRAGANSVVVKTGEFDELTTALRSAAQRGWSPPGAKRADG